MEKGLVFGLNIGDLLEIYDQDLQSWKMSGCLFTGDYAKSSGVLPKSGIMLNGKIYVQQTWMHRTKGKGYGLLPTPQATQRGGTSHGYGDSLDERIKSIEGVPTRKYPTPQSRDWKWKSQRGKHGNKTDCLPNTIGGQLNPMWVDWLMGYPIGWTDLRDSGMQLSLK